MNIQLKFATLTVAIACTAMLWPNDDNQTKVELNPQVSTTIAPMESELKELDFEANMPLMQNHNDPTLDSDLAANEVIVFATTEEYEANSRYGKLPSHLSDIAIERFSVDSNGQLVINESIKNIFEYFLMASHIEGKEQAIARIMEYIELNLSGEAAANAQQIASNYLLYKANQNTDRFAMSTDFSQQENLNMLRTALDDKKQTRRQYLGDTVSEALFGHEERYDDFSYQRLAINSDPSLSDAEKDEKMAQAEQQLPTKMAADMRYKREERKLNSKVDELKGQAGKENEIYKLRADFYGERVAKRMEYLESNTPEWQARVSDFYQIQKNILESNSLSKEEKRVALKEAKDNAFSHKEQVKLAVQSIRGIQS